MYSEAESERGRGNLGVVDTRLEPHEWYRRGLGSRISELGFLGGEHEEAVNPMSGP